MLFSAEGVTLGASLPFSVIVGVAVGVITYRAQIHWYGDTKDSAMTKSLILALLTAIPTALPMVIYLPAGVIGFFRKRS